VRIEVAEDPDAAAQAAAVWIARRARDAVRRRGSFTLAVSGGSTPARMFEMLATLDVPWKHVEVYQVDERVAPDGSADRNATQLLERLGGLIRKANLHLLPVGAGQPQRAAARCARELPERLDVVHLGLGDDGHTASWPPGDPVGALRGPGAPAVAVVGPFNGLVRFTLTPPVVNGARSRLVLATGAAKAPVVAKWLLGDASLPISAVRRQDTWVVLDQAAAGQLAASVSSPE
jgi:6-phosphogluconolactonase